MNTENIISNKTQLDLWKKCLFLTVDEAMNLIMGFVPRTYKFDFMKEENMPNGSVPLYKVLIQDIRNFKLHIYFNEIEVTDESILSELNVVSHDEYLYSCWWHKGKLLKESLRKWLQQKSISSEFFEIKQIDIPDYMNSDLEMHSYKLAAAIKAWEHFYVNGLTFPRKSPKQNIVEWLTQNAESLGLTTKKNKGQLELNKTAIEEIAKIVNWKPEGGAPTL